MPATSVATTTRPNIFNHKQSIIENLFSPRQHGQVIIMQEKVLEDVRRYEVKCSGKDVDYVITEVIEDESEGAALYLFESEKDGIKSAAFAYESGEVFVLTDWQGSRPEKLSEVADYDWVTISGHDAINLNGYPRKFC